MKPGPIQRIIRLLFLLAGAAWCVGFAAFSYAGYNFSNMNSSRTRIHTGPTAGRVFHK